MWCSEYIAGISKVFRDLIGGRLSADSSSLSSFLRSHWLRAQGLSCCGVRIPAPSDSLLLPLSPLLRLRRLYIYALRAKSLLYDISGIWQSHAAAEAKDVSAYSRVTLHSFIDWLAAAGAFPHSPRRYRTAELDPHGASR
ncbi:hypothetical protein FIBSPDRAFT_489775 [Athelia psychrophila]|uniref:Uncharacterized protein n=1 Tax=Athelia psychrophila TaxID=1759441 RepID=A0A167TV78_9AGAM|nr:hypothetical protein FIBSPDRAFT_489775 [Fibularhizoctonia sp. CBS 109695]